ncbi:MAG: hypothetical protein HND58_16925 [Planctomycetota bacterium]|nr:MAG: hypothetical protein HND58_16925 [Planctomycetota bacterium]
MQQRTSSNWNARRLGLAVLAGGSLALASVAGGCNNAGEGALSGATLGALAGMGLGSLSGDMGKGAAAGRDHRRRGRRGAGRPEQPQQPQLQQQRMVISPAHPGATSGACRQRT